MAIYVRDSTANTARRDDPEFVQAVFAEVTSRGPLTSRRLEALVAAGDLAR